VPLSESIPDVATLAGSGDPEQVLALDAAVTRLEKISPDPGIDRLQPTSKIVSGGEDSGPL
jgi:hypothetical protein